MGESKQIFQKGGHTHSWNSLKADRRRRRGRQFGCVRGCRYLRRTWSTLARRVKRAPLDIYLHFAYLSRISNVEQSAYIERQSFGFVRSFVDMGLPYICFPTEDSRVSYLLVVLAVGAALPCSIWRGTARYRLRVKMVDDNLTVLAT